MASRTTELMMMIKAMYEGRLVLLMGPINDRRGGKTYSERAEPAEEEAAFYL